MSLLRKVKRSTGWCFVGAAGVAMVLGLLSSGCPGPDRGPGGTYICIACHDGRSAPDVSDFVHGFHAKGGVACQECHGDGALHVRNGGRAGLFILNPASLSLKDLSDLCGRCHSEEAGTFSKSLHSTHDAVRCTGCHDQHGADETVLPADNNALCLSCHGPYGFDTDKAVSTHTHHPVDPAGTGSSRCIGCHMVPLVRVNQDAGAHDHSFEPIPPSRSNEQIAAGQTALPNSCAGTMGCHDGTVPTSPTFDVDNPAVNSLLQTLYTEWFGTEETDK